jgi:sodium/bile acid cotransporter 7
VCSASLSNLIGIVLTPLLVGVVLHPAPGAGGFDWHAVRGIVEQLLVPFVAGHLLRPLIGKWVDRHKRILLPVDRGSILLVVYTAFSAAVVNGIWQKLDLADLASLLGLSAVILAAIMVVNFALAKLARLPREDAVVLLFCGSKKSLVSGVPMAGALFAPAQVGMVVLPLMIFHQLQLFVCAWLAARYGRAAPDAEAPVAAAVPEVVPAPAAPAVAPLVVPADAPVTAPVTAPVVAPAAAATVAAPGTIPRAPEEIAAAASVRGLTISPECAEGVSANLALLAEHAARLRR